MGRKKSQETQVRELCQGFAEALLPLLRQKAEEEVNRIVDEQQSKLKASLEEIADDVVVLHFEDGGTLGPASVPPDPPEEESAEVVQAVVGETPVVFQYESGVEEVPDDVEDLIPPTLPHAM